MSSTKTPPHPGKIVFIDGDTGKVIDQDNASEVPEDVAYAETDDGLVPVVKVVAHTLEDRRTIEEYGPNDELLRSTLQIKE